MTSELLPFPLPEEALREAAEAALEGVGETGAEWREMRHTGAYHLRRRLTLWEQQFTGPVVDVRGTEEAMQRARRAGLVNPRVAAFALDEALEAKG